MQCTEPQISKSESPLYPVAGCSSQEKNPDKSTSKKRKTLEENVTVEIEVSRDNCMYKTIISP